MAAEGKDQEVANRIAIDVVKFFNSIPNAKHTDIILNTSTLVEYIHTLKERDLAPSTIIDKLRNLRLCIEYLSTCKLAIDSTTTSSKCEETIKWLQKRAKVLRKDVRMQQFSNAMKGENAVDNAGNPRDFWSNPDVKKEVYTILKKAETGDHLTNNEHSTVLAYLAAILIYKNSQRPGVVENMTIHEFQQRRDQGDGRVLIRVLKHKTSASTGPANIIINKNCEEVMCQYHDLIRSNIPAQNVASSKLLFLTSNGSSFKKISETIQKVAAAYSISVPTASLHRKVTKTTAHCDEITEGKMRALSRHMSHSDATSSKFYQLPAAKTAVDIYNTIKQLSKKKFFTPQEDTIVTKEWPIEKAATPSLELCRRISERHNMQRTAKQLQDRWLTLSKKAI